MMAGSSFYFRSTKVLNRTRQTSASPWHAGGRPQTQASEPSSCGQSPVQSVRRPLRHLAAYGSTNKYRPVKD
jgi:hypothetical protein